MKEDLEEDESDKGTIEPLSDVEKSAGDVADLIENVEIDIPEVDDTLVLGDLMTDVTNQHYELSSVKRGALTYCDALDDRIKEEREAGRDDLVDLLEEVRDATFGLYLRVKRGDEELMGDRDGEYSGYFEMKN